MAFKIVEKSAGIEGIADNELSIGGYGISFGTEISMRLNGFTHAEIYLDKEQRRVGFKPTNNSLTGFKIGVDKNGKGKKSITGSWARRLPNRRFLPTFENDMIIISDCDVADKKPRKLPNQ